MGTPTWQRRLLETLTRIETTLTRLDRGHDQIVERLEQIVDNTAVGPRSLRGRIERVERHLGLPPVDETR